MGGGFPSLNSLHKGSGTGRHRCRPIPRLPGLHVVPAGARPVDPTGLLDSLRMQELLTAWRLEYDHIVIDTPPVLPFADAMVLAARADGVILVARSGMSRAAALLRAREVLARSGARLLGVVLNAVKSRASFYGYGYPAETGKPSETGSAEETRA
jgi:Mrp family chromosome partitioning ATPase